MKNDNPCSKLRSSYPALLALACLFWACVSQPTVEKEAVPETVPAPATEKPAVQAVRLPSGNGLNSARFRDLPPEAKEYLETLAEAFRRKDKDFLISQGETHYEKELRPKYDEKAYLAMLYRYGPYSEDGPWKPITLPHLDTSLISAIEYTDWKENGPMLDINFRLYQQNGEQISCMIMLAWRLLEPKILGVWP